MQTRAIKRILILCSMVLWITGCDKSAALGPLKTEAMKLVSEHSSKLVGLKGLLGNLSEKVNSIPDSMPGASAIKSAIGEKMGALTTMEGALGGAEGKITELMKAGDKEGLSDFVGEIKGMGSKLSDLESFGKETTEKVAEMEAAAAKGAAGEDAMSYSKRLSTGYELSGAEDGVEAQLVGFLDDKDREIDEKAWFNFDRLTFPTGSSNLDMEKSKAQLTNMQEILKAYPDSKVKVGGYTDNTGNKKANVKLSQKRADSVKKALVDMGVDGGRIEAEGYGQEHPVCEANDTEECKKQNRRIAVNVTSK